MGKYWVKIYLYKTRNQVKLILGNIVKIKFNINIKKVITLEYESIVSIGLAFKAPVQV